MSDSTPLLILLPLFALLWFALGIIIGRQMTPESKKQGGRNRNRKPSRGKTRSRSTATTARTQRASSAGRTELYVGNLPYEVTEKDVRKVFERHGKVVGVRLIENRHNGKPKGFGFVEMADGKNASAAAKALNGSTLMGRSLVVNSAKSRERD